MKFNPEKNYVRLDDDVSFQILRTNPKLTTNTKLMYDGENLYMDSYPVNPLLSTMKYKHHKVWKTGLFNRDIKNFLLGTSTAAYEVGKVASDTTILNSFDNQFENIYWCGVEAINSEIYPQEMGCIAPLYLRKKRPNYFVVFKIDTPANTNLVKLDQEFDFNKDVLSRAKILKSFDLREGTPIGDYIKRYVEQRDFKYDQSIYVNFSTNEIYYYGIDRSLGVLTQKVENFEESLLKNDSTMMSDDNWFTSGFERNNLIFPYILNIEFLFDDKSINEYKFARYFGMYCNDIDICDMTVGNCQYDKENKSTALISGWDSSDYIDLYDNSFHYIKDKKGNLYSISATSVPGMYKSPVEIKKEDVTGYEITSTSTFAERIPGVGKAFMILELQRQLDKNDTLSVFDEITRETVGTFIATTQYSKGEYYGNRFSCKGTIEDTASAIAGCIRDCKDGYFNWLTAFNEGNKIIVQAVYPGTNLNNLFNFSGSVLSTNPPKMKKVMKTFSGGTDLDNCIFKVYTDDSEIFYGNGVTRYVKCGTGRINAQIISPVLPLINDDNKIDDTYSIIITDSQGPYVGVSKTNQIEILDKFYPRVGILSFFPVKDFDFDTVSSAYGNYAMLEDELKTLQDKMYDDDSDPDYVGQIRMNRKIMDIVPYKRFYDEGKDIDTEYDYYCENILPEQATVSKSVPYITKWGYMDEAKDSCENPYRLNVSKIFEACNFSANTFMQNGDISEYTHSMPYYLVDYKGSNGHNEYQYIPLTKNGWTNNYESLLAYFSRKKSDGLGDPFEEMFGNLSETQFTNKRFNKKYSRFLLGDGVVKSSTLFRGVKFELTEIEKDKEVNTGKYNGYKFSFIYVPVVNSDDGSSDFDEDELKNHTVHFIKNDDYKFIVGIVFVGITPDSTQTGDSIANFNKSYVYAGAIGYIDIE